jgi:thioredoxin 1
MKMNKVIQVGMVIVAGWCSFGYAKVIDMKDNQSVLESKQRMIIKFAATWCTTCQSVADLFEALSDEQEFLHITFVRVDIDQYKEVSTQHGVIGVPTFAYLENGSKKGQLTGTQDIGTFKDHIRDSLRSHFNLPAPVTVVAQADVDFNDYCMRLAHGQSNEGMFEKLWHAMVHLVDDVTDMIKRVFA